MDRTLMVLVSGAGSTLYNLCAKIYHGHLKARVVCAVCNHRKRLSADVAGRWKVPYWVLDPKDYPPQDMWDDVFGDLVEAYDPGLIVLAGFDRLLRIPEGYEERVINVHPSLLPEFGGRGMYGNRVHEAVLEAKVSQTGCTIHLCDCIYDHGRVLAQDTVDVLPEDTVDTLRQRVQVAERRLLPEAIAEYLDVLEAKNIY